MLGRSSVCETSSTVSCNAAPTCCAARPTPLAACIVSSMSGGKFADMIVHFLHSFPFERAGLGHRISRSAVSFLAVGESGQIFHARQFQRVHHLDDRAERCLLVGLQGERGPCARWSDPERPFPVHRRRSAWPSSLISSFSFTLTMACSSFRGSFRRSLRFRQIDLHFRLIFFESGRDDEKDQQNRQDIDEGNDDDRGRPPFPDCDFMASKERQRYSTVAAHGRRRR